MNIIVAVDANWGIGKDGDLLVSIPADKKFFRQETMGKVVVMGRKTLESLPGGRPLPGRVNVVLSRDPEYAPKDTLVAHSEEELDKILAEYDKEDVYVIGGGSIYKLLLSRCSLAHVTRIDRAYEADTWFPNLDEDPEWEITGISDEQTYFDITYHFVRYERKNK